MTPSPISSSIEPRREEAEAEEVQLLREVELLRPSRATWPRVRFGDMVRLNTDRTAAPLAAGIERFVGLEHIEPEDLRIRRWGLVADGTTFTNRFRPGQVLFGKRRAYQRKVAVADFEGVCSSDIYVFESKDPSVLMPELLPFLCQTEGFFQHAVGTSAGSLSPRTNWTQLANYEFALPPLEEQQRMAEVLCAVERVASQRSNLEISANLVLRATAFSSFRLLQNQGVPEHQLANICSQLPQSGLYKSKEHYGKGVRMIHMGELFGNDCVDQNTAMQLVDLTDAETGRYTLTHNDLLFGRRSIVLEGAGRCVLVGKLDDSITFESSIIRVTLDHTLADNRYVFEWFRSPEGQRHIQGIITFTTVAGVKGSDVARLRVPVPNLQVQQSIADQLEHLRIGVRQIEAAATKARIMSKAVIAEVFG